MSHLYRERIVVKVGTSTLTNEAGGVDLRSFEMLARVLSDIHGRGYQVILVSSGAIAIGSDRLGMEPRPKSLRAKQAAAAVGQCRILFLYDKFFGEYGKTTAQILLNADDVEREEKRANLVNTFDTLLDMGIIPVVNENDSVSFGEIESDERLFGDNDVLSAIVAVLCRAHKLVILSDIDGLYERDPRSNPKAKLIDVVEDVADVGRCAGGAGSLRGTGGMKTKLQAADLATRNGIDAVILNGRRLDRLYTVLDGGRAGTVFAARPKVVRDQNDGTSRFSLRA